MPSPDLPSRASDAAAELSALIREAHGAVRDLATLLRDYRNAAAAGTDAASTAAAEAADSELKRFSRHLQKEMNRYAADLNAAVDAARDHVIKCLMVSRLEPDPEKRGHVQIRFEGSKFQADVPLPGGPDDGQPSA